MLRIFFKRASAPLLHKQLSSLTTPRARSLPLRCFSVSSDEKDPPKDPENDKEPKIDDVKESSIEADLEDMSAQLSRSLVPKRGVPSYPNVVVVPMINKPLFPGTYFAMNIQDEKLVQALKGQQEAGIPYCGVFLRKTDGPAFGETNDLDAAASAEVVPPESDTTTVIDPPASPLEEKIEDKDGHTEHDARLDDIYSMGVLAQIHKITMGDKKSGSTVLMLAHRRVQIKHASSAKNDVLMVRVTHLEDKTQRQLDKLPQEEKDMIRACSTEILSTIKEILTRNPLFRDHLQLLLNNADVTKPGMLAYYAAGLTTAAGEQLQEVLEAPNLQNRLMKALALLKAELEITKLQATISKQINDNMTKKQREHMLHEQLKSIKRELGMEKDDKESLAQKFRTRLEGKKVPEDVSKVIEEELEKLSVLEPASMEFNITRNYLDWLTNIPYGVYTQENFAIDHAEQVLKEDHYGLEDVKERILEFIAVGNLMGSASQGKIICLVGPPGVGKTSVAKSIARSLNRQFFRFSVGGMYDVAEIKGHRRTYVGAMPGKLVQCLKKVQCANPVILIDEIDKIGVGRSQGGDPSSALLEVLDPEQNSSFMDHYLDVPVDLSKVLFICTANVKDTIPGPLADRMDFMRLSGYIWQEKLHIARQFLQPALSKNSGVDASKITITEGAINQLVRYYCREAGVRNLQKHMEKIFRKVALRLVRPSPKVDSVVVDENNLVDFVGHPNFPRDRMYEHTPAGVVMGLAWNPHGGTALYIEAVVADHYDVAQQYKEVETADGVSREEDAEAKAPVQIPDKTLQKLEKILNRKGGRGVLLTGMLGDVMKESSTIAYTVAKEILFSVHPESDFFARNRVHMHVPEGATPKDGPSAGIAMVTSLLSLALNKPIIPNVAMTGEVTLTGKVLPIGGVKEKTIAAKSSLVEHLILPAANKKDFDELPDYVKADITVHYVHWYQDVFKVVFPSEATTSK